MSLEQYGINTSSTSEKTDENAYGDMLKIKDTYYKEHSKNILFKTAQKFDCAKQMCSKLDVVDLMNSTFWLIPNKNQFYIDYRIYKLYANPDIFQLIVDNIIRMCKWCISEYGVFEVHINLSSFTVSAAERHRTIINLFNQTCMQDTQHQFTDKLCSLNIHNVPSAIDNITHILLPLFPCEVLPKIKMFKKEESHAILSQIYANSNKTYTP
jgi:hypothetical protein